MKPKLLLLGLGLGLVGCSFFNPQNIDQKAPDPEASNRFLLEDRAEIRGNPIYVLRDKKTGNLLYLTPGSGVWVRKDN